MCVAVVTAQLNYRPPSHPRSQRRSQRLPECVPAAAGLYTKALELAREELWDDARHAFEDAVTACPSWQKPWVSWAQMEKRAAIQAQLAAGSGIGLEESDRWRRCRAVLQRALTMNPSSAQIIQAWGLMELQRSNLLPAVRLLERCAAIDRTCAPVLRQVKALHGRPLSGLPRLKAFVSWIHPVCRCLCSYNRWGIDACALAVVRRWKHVRDAREMLSSRQRNN